jgi:hypothetical protein
VLVEAGVTTTTVPFRSILFDRPSDAVERADPAVFTDLNLDQVFAGVTAGRWVGRGRDSARHVKVKLITR